MLICKKIRRFNCLRTLSLESEGKPLPDDLQKALGQVNLQNEAPQIAGKLESTRAQWAKLYTQALQHDSDAVEKYNSLLSEYKDYVQRVSIQLTELGAESAYQQRVNRSLRLYQMMPKYNAPQSINIDVRNCTALPALCAGQQ